MAREPASTSSTEVASRRVRVGRILGAHGLRGELRVGGCSDDPAVFRSGSVLQLRNAARPDAAREVEVVSSRPGRPGELLLALHDVGERDGAEALRGSELFVPAERLSALLEDECYAFELVGCRVEDETGLALGVVKEVCSAGASTWVVFTDACGREQLVPLALLRGFEREAGRLRIEALPGLLIEGRGADAKRGPAEASGAPGAAPAAQSAVPEEGR